MYLFLGFYHNAKIFAIVCATLPSTTYVSSGQPSVPQTSKGGQKKIEHLVTADVTYHTPTCTYYE